MQSKPELTSAQQKWVDALRSGKYKQGRGALCREDRYCCLGVACELFKDELGLKVSEDTYGDRMYDGDCRIVHDKIINHLRLFDQAGAAPGRVCLTVLNDEGMSFEGIADAIETGAYFRPTEVG